MSAFTAKLGEETLSAEESTDEFGTGAKDECEGEFPDDTGGPLGDFSKREPLVNPEHGG